MATTHRFVLARPWEVRSEDYIRIDGQQIHAAQVEINHKERTYKFCRTSRHGRDAVAPYLEVWEPIPDPVELELNIWEPD
jgi:hypothetical protein